MIKLYDKHPLKDREVENHNKRISPSAVAKLPFYRELIKGL